jgi:thioredoxin reductase (NADPH)
MSSYLRSRLEADPKITIEYDAEVTALHGADSLEAVTVRKLKTGETRLLHIPALFIMVGAAPNTEWLSGLEEVDGKGFVITGRGAELVASPFGTSQPGVFAVGDVRGDRSSA